MDLSNLSDLTKMFIFQRMKSRSVIRVRKSSKYFDNFVEHYRQDIAKYVTDDMICKIFTVKSRITREGETKLKYGISFKFSVSCGSESTRICLDDPYKQLSAISFSQISMSIAKSLSRPEMENALQHSLLPCLMRLKPICNRFEADELPTETMLKITNFIRIYNFMLSSDRTCVSIIKIIGNPIVQRCTEITLEKFLSDLDECSVNILKCFAGFSTIHLHDVRKSFITNMIMKLTSMPNLGRLKKISVHSFISILGGLYSPNVSEVLHKNGTKSAILYSSEANEKEYFVIRIFYGVSKWIIGVDYPVSDEGRKVDLSIIDQDYSLVLDKLVELTMKPEVDVSSIRDDYINAPGMMERYKIFRTFHTQLNIFDTKPNGPAEPLPVSLDQLHISISTHNSVNDVRPTTAQLNPRRRYNPQLVFLLLAISIFFIL